MQDKAGEAIAASDTDDLVSSTAAAAGSPAVMDRRRHLRALWCVALTVLALDVSSKVIAVEVLPSRGPIELLGGLLTLRLTRNPGAAFSIGVNLTLIFTVVAVLVIVAILRQAKRLYSLPWAIALGGLLGGALGNLVDRVFRSPGVLRGHVVDFLELPNWPVFNLADSAIVGAGALMVLLAIRGIPFEGRPPAA